MVGEVKNRESACQTQAGISYQGTKPTQRAMELIQADDGSLVWLNPETGTYQLVEIEGALPVHPTSQYSATTSRDDTSLSIIDDVVRQPSPETSTMKRSRQTFWSKAETLLFLKLAKDRKGKLDNPKLSKKDIHGEIAKEMSKYGYNFTPEQCVGRMKTLLSKYKEIKDHNDTSGNDHKQWEYFDIIGEYIGDRPSVTPKGSCSSISQKAKVAMNNSCDKEAESTSHNAPKKRKIKSHPRGTMLNWLKDHSESVSKQEEQRFAMAERHHAENLELMKSLVEVMKEKKNEENN